MKKFFSTLNLQKNPNANMTTLYELDESCGFEKNIRTCNPIMPFLLNNVEKDERIALYLIMCKGDGEYAVYSGKERAYVDIDDVVVTQHKANYEKELSEIKMAKGGFDCEIIPIELDGNSNRSYLKLARDIMSCISDGDIVFMDVTFGFKPVSVIQFIALNYAYKIRRNVEIGSLSYGSHYGTRNHVDKIYNLTAFFLLHNLMGNISGMEHPEMLIDKLIADMIAEGES